MTNAERMTAECKRLGDHAADLQRALNAAKARIAELEAECFTLAATQCTAPSNDERGHFVCLAAAK